MSIRIFDLIKRDFFGWLIKSCEETVNVSSDGFWVDPIDKSDANYENACRKSEEVIKSLKDVVASRSPWIKGLWFKDEVDVFLCLVDFAGLEKVQSAFPDEYEELEVDFLVSILVVTKLGLDCSRPVPSRLIVESAQGGALAGDFIEYLPVLRLFRLREDRAHYTPPMVFSCVFCDAYVANGGAWLEDEARELLLSLPQIDHDWLFYEFDEIFASPKHLKSMYLGSYRLVEFFFPIPAVGKLRDDLAPADSLLAVLARCRDALGWFWQHGRAARGAIELIPSCDFIKPLSEVGLVAAADVDPRDAAEKMVNIRNELAHQAFKGVSYPDPVLRGCIRAALKFCAHAFYAYKIMADGKPGWANKTP